MVVLLDGSDSVVVGGLVVAIGGVVIGGSVVFELS